MSDFILQIYYLRGLHSFIFVNSCLFHDNMLSLFSVTFHSYWKYKIIPSLCNVRKAWELDIRTRSVSECAFVTSWRKVRQSERSYVMKQNSERLTARCNGMEQPINIVGVTECSCWKGDVERISTLNSWVSLGKPKERGTILYLRIPKLRAVHCQTTMSSRPVAATPSCHMRTTRELIRLIV
jgi:hypothetical protein